jgi:GT2 family glycosyltransferase
MNALIVPTTGLDVTILTRLAESIDYPIPHKVIINNGRWYDLDQWGAKFTDWKILERPDNLGCAGSWNLAAEIMPHEKAWLICNDDIAFKPGVLETLCAFADENCEGHDALRLNESYPYYCFIHTQKNIEDFGTFDANFWPAYYEDCDYNVRVRLAGGTFKNCYPGQNQVIHGKPRTGGMDYNAMLQGMGLFNRHYWMQKWGSMNLETASYLWPFNLAERDHHFWKLDQMRRDKMHVLWDEFMATKNPSIYD